MSLETAGRDPASPSLDAVEREALELAANHCVGSYGIAHLKAWDRLDTLGLVRKARSGTAARYEPTDRGREMLRRIAASGPETSNI